MKNFKNQNLLLRIRNIVFDKVMLFCFVFVCLYSVELLAQPETPNTNDVSNPETFLKTWTWLLGGFVQLISGYLVPLFPKLNNLTISKPFKVIITGLPVLLLLIFSVFKGKTFDPKILSLVLEAILTGMGLYSFGKAVSPETFTNKELK